MVNYPAQIDTSISIPPAIDNLTPVMGLVYNRLRDSVIAIETELGVKPSGVYTTVRSRLDYIENLIVTDFNNLEIIKLAGDLGGTIDNPLVVGLQGNLVSPDAPVRNEVLTWTGLAWESKPINQFLQNIIYASVEDPDASADYYMTNTDQLIIGLNHSSYPATLNIFLTDTPINGQRIIIKKKTDDQMILNVNGNGNNIDDSGTPVVCPDYGALTFVWAEDIEQWIISAIETFYYPASSIYTDTTLFNTILSSADTDAQKAFITIDGHIQRVDKGGTGLTSCAAGDILYGSGIDVISKLSIGDDGYVLGVVGGLPTWVIGGGTGSGATGPTGATGPYGNGMTFSFTSGDLIAGILNINHNLNNKYVIVEIYDNLDKKNEPDFVTLVDANNVEIDLSSYSIVGTWNAAVYMGAGATGSIGATGSTGSTGPSGNSFVYAFDDGYLDIDGYLTVNHNLNNKYISVDVYDNVDVLIELSSLVTLIDANNTNVYLFSHQPLSGTWHVVIHS